MHEALSCLYKNSLAAFVLANRNLLHVEEDAFLRLETANVAQCWISLLCPHCEAYNRGHLYIDTIDACGCLVFTIDCNLTTILG